MDPVLGGLPRFQHYIPFDGAKLKADRLRETDRDFVIFDLMLLMTSVLAAVGIANQMLLSLHGRRREIALYRVLGMTAPQVRRLVLLEGGFIGLLGGGLAVLLGRAARLRGESARSASSRPSRSTSSSPPPT